MEGLCTVGGNLGVDSCDSHGQAVELPAPGGLSDASSEALLLWSEAHLLQQGFGKAMEGV